MENKDKALIVAIIAVVLSAALYGCGMDARARCIGFANNIEMAQLCDK